MTVRVCAERGCPNFRPCPVHPPLRGVYGRAYRKRRAPLIGQPCALRLPGCTGIATTADHLIPVHHGGRNGPLVPACWSCNRAKSDRVA